MFVHWGISMSRLLSPYTPRKIALIAILGTISLALLKEVVTGIVDGAAYDLFKSTWNPIYNSVRTDPLPWSIIIALLICLLALAFILWLDRRKLDLTNDLANTLNDFDLILFGLLSSFFASIQEFEAKISQELEAKKKHELEAEMKQALDAGLKQVVNVALSLAIKAVKDTHRAALFLPNDKGELIIQEHQGMSEESIKRIKCYGGLLPPGVTQRGVAGEAFKEKKLIVAHIIEKEKGMLVADTSAYIYTNSININGQEILLPISYRSLVCIPLTADGIQEPLGVLCFDSQNLMAFDSQETKDRLQSLEDRFIPILSIYQRLKKVIQMAQVSTISNH